MLLRLRKRGSPPGNASVFDPSIESTHETAHQTQLRDWRRSAQRVTCAWNAWLAAEGGDRGVRYRTSVSALADEERAAAEVERMIQRSDAGECARSNP